MIQSKIYTEEEFYVDDIDQPEDDLKCIFVKKKNIYIMCSNIMRHNTIVDKKTKQKKENARILKEQSRPLQCEYCHKTFMTKCNLKRNALNHM